MRKVNIFLSNCVVICMHTFFSSIDFHSCKDYADSGINVDGHYYMFLNGSSNIESIYCDFKAIEFGTCHDYYLKNFTEAGEYTVYLKSKPYKVICDFSKGISRSSNQIHNLVYK